MKLCIIFFVLGFLTDKIRLFPFVLGVILGMVLKSMLEKNGILVFESQLYDKLFQTTKESEHQHDE